MIRTGLPQVDLLDGGAIGIGGGQQRHSSNATVALTRGATGFRFNAAWRGPSYLQTGTLAAPDRLTFGALFKLDVRMFADLGSLLPGSKFAKGTRLTLAVENITAQRQRVVKSTGSVPLSYQPGYRDPVGQHCHAGASKGLLVCLRWVIWRGPFEPMKRGKCDNDG